MSKKHKQRAHTITAPLVDPSLPKDAHRGVALEDTEAFEDAAYIRVDGEFFAYVMGPGCPGRPAVAKPGDPIPSGVEPNGDSDIPF